MQQTLSRTLQQLTRRRTRNHERHVDSGHIKMTLHLHHLTGCSPTPLANYLKALGILRLVAEQSDASARGWWQDEHFCLLTRLSREELESFFLTEYQPTPMLSPWNGGSGFFRTWDPKKRSLRNNKNAAALDDLLSNCDARFQQLRDAYEEICKVLPLYCKHVDVSAITDKERGKLLIVPTGDGPVFPVIEKNDSGKNQVQRALLRASHCTPFYRSAIIEVNEEIKYPSLWGSGGNDGAIDYTGRFFENVRAITEPKDKSNMTMLLDNAMRGELSIGLLSKAAGKVGQFLPSGAGGANITTGPGSQNDTHLNPWDFVLMLEGAVLFTVRSTKRLDSKQLNRVSAPFAVQSHATGYATPGMEKSQRGEQWLPLWEKPTTLFEVAELLSEGRLQLGRQTANRPIDAARAISRLGVARGIDSFVRFGYLERNGQSNLAVPLGRIRVQQHPRAYLVDDLATWLDRLQRNARDKNAPARLGHCERMLADSVLSALTHDDSPDRWQAVLRNAVDLESLQATGSGINAGPIPPLRVEWVNAIDDGSPEVRLAVALGSAAWGYSKHHRPFDPVRHHWLPLERGARRFKTSDKRLAKDSRVVISGRDPIGDCTAIVERRFIEAGMKSERRLRLVSAFGAGARLDDLALFISGHVDVQRVFDLARALMAVKWDEWQLKNAPRSKRTSETPPEAWLALRLACLPWPLADGRNIPSEPSIVRRLQAGDGSGATQIALARLLSAGIRPPLQAAMTDAQTAKLWAAALVFPIDRRSATRAVAILDPSTKGVQHA